MKQKKNSLKLLTNNEEYIKYVQSYISNGVDITSAVKNLCAYYSIEYSDSLRRQFSKKLESLGLTNNTTKEVPLEQSNEYKEALTRELPTSKYYLISSCQAETALHKEFWNNMVAFSKHIGGEILISPIRYKNPTSLESNRKIKEKEVNKSIWAEEVRPYLYASKLKLNKYLTALMNLKIQPTAKLPLSGINGFTGESSSIVPSPKVQLDTMSVLPSNPQKLLLTTGSVTIPQYTDTKIGAQAEFEHEFGFVLAEIVDNEKYFVHQVVADDSGSFYFLDYYVSNGKVEKTDEFYPAVVFGDIHYGETDPHAYQASIDIVKRLNANNVFLHDVGNFHSISHHDLKSPLTLLKKEEEGLDDLGKELNMIKEELLKLRNTIYSHIHIVESNHPLWLNRWLDGNDWRKSNNKKLYLELAHLVASGKTGDKGVLNYLIDTWFDGEIKTYTEDDSLKIKGYEMLIHGHRGTASSKGSIQQYKALSTKGISCHTHVARRVSGWLTAGTLTTLKPDYVRGLSAWIHSNVVIAPNGKPTHIHIINGEYSTL